jgi:hypothetical protein
MPALLLARNIVTGKRVQFKFWRFMAATVGLGIGGAFGMWQYGIMKMAWDLSV